MKGRKLYKAENGRLTLESWFGKGAFKTLSLAAVACGLVFSLSSEKDEKLKSRDCFLSGRTCPSLSEKSG